MMTLIFYQTSIKLELGLYFQGSRPTLQTTQSKLLSARIETSVASKFIRVYMRNPLLNT